VQEFLLNNYSLFTHSVELIAAIVGLLYYNRYKDAIAKYFIWFLVYVAIIELIGAYPRFIRYYEFLSPIKNFLAGSKFERNHWWFTLCWHVGSAVFYAFYFREIIESSRLKAIIKICVLLFLGSSTLYILLHWDAFFVSFFPFIFIISVSIILLSIILYFIEVLQSEKLVKFYTSLNFYIGVVVFIWALITTPLVFFDVYFSTEDMDFVMLRAVILLSSNMFMYLGFVFALIWCRPRGEQRLKKVKG